MKTCCHQYFFQNHIIPKIQTLFNMMHNVKFLMKVSIWKMVSQTISHWNVIALQCVGFCYTFFN